MNRPKSDYAEEIGESIANSLGTDVYYRYSHGSVPERISTEKVNSRSLGSIIEIRLIFLMIFHERRKDFPFFYSFTPLELDSRQIYLGVQFGEP